MSHWSKIKFQIKSITALEKAAKKFNCELVEGVNARGYGATRKADFTIKIPEASYDIAVTKQLDNTFTLETDFWGGSVEQILGKGLNGLKQEYSACNAEIESQKLGHSVHRELMENGNIKLHLSIGN